MKPVSTLLLAMATLLPLAPAQAQSGEPRTDWSDQKLHDEAVRLMDSFLTIDTHMDVPIVLRRPDFDISEAHTWQDDASQVDFPRMDEGHLDGGFFVVYVGQGPLTPEGRKAAIEEGFSIAHTIHSVAEAHPDECGIATTPEEAEKLREDGKHVIFMGIENGYTIGQDIGLLQDYYDLGVRYFGITHSSNNDLADSSTDKEGELHFGLSDLGRAAVEECNRLGIMVDISHAGDKTVYDILEHSKAPIIASHSGCYACYPHPRSLNDALLKAIAKRGGVVQMNVFSGYMMDPQDNPERSQAYQDYFQKYHDWESLSDAEKAEATEARIEIERQFPKPLVPLKEVVDHIDHMVSVMGIDHVGISGDFDGGGGAEDLMSVGDYVNVTVEMLRRGYTEDDLRKFWGGNAMRVLSEARRVADEMAQAS
ncbi:MAG: membrane dipeptidase [Puniceicoccaceae bacterium 5H]|nr:MAG: membrane dipeptidase [Puniceicoccaceae bacterium 5H]